MAKLKVMSVYGTRPEAIKLAPVIKALEDDGRFESVAVSTGQHKEMLDQVNQMFGISPAFDLKLMKSSQSLNELVSRAITGLDAVIKEVAPDTIVVQGDTSTAMAAAMAGFHSGVKIVHLEAGLRTGDIGSPFPEEANRKIISQIASLHLAPTDGAQKNLQIENVPSDDIVVTGNTVIDALLDAVQWDTEFDDDDLAKTMASSRRVVVVTTHRRENHHAMHEIGSAVQTLAKLYTEVDFVLPLHLNPAVRESVLPEIESRPNVIITGPLPYDQFTKLQSRASFILTDSGGVQEEAPSLGTPVLLMRGNTERPEAIVAGTVKLVGTKERLIVAEARMLLDDDAVFAEMANSTNPYGDGKASIRSVAAIAELLGIGSRIEGFSPYLNK